MTVSLKHKFNCTKADGTDATVVKPSDWNNEHDLTATPGRVLGTTPDSSDVKELPITVDNAGQSVVLPSGTLGSRPAAPLTGATRYNTTTAKLEYFTNNTWKNVDNVTFSSSQPTNPLTGDIWVDSGGENMAKVYTGAAWVAAVGTTLSDFRDILAGGSQGDTLFRGASGWLRLAAGSDGAVYRSNGPNASPGWRSPPGAPDVIIQDHKPANTGGGTSLAGLNTRTLNTIVRNVDNMASLSANQITLPAGKYYAEWSCPASGANGHQSQLYNASKNDGIERGRSAASASGTTTESEGCSYFSETSGSFKIELRHRITTSVATTGLGIPANAGADEIYSSIRIWRL